MGMGWGGQAGVEMNLAPLAGKALVGPGGDVARQSTPHKPG